MRERGTSYIYCRGDHYPDKKRAFPLSGDVNERLPKTEHRRECEAADCTNHTRLCYCLEHFPRVRVYSGIGDIMAGIDIKDVLCKLITISCESHGRINNTRGALLIFDLVALNYDLLVFMRSYNRAWERLWNTTVKKYKEFCGELGQEFAVRYAFIDNEDEEAPPDVAPLVF